MAADMRRAAAITEESSATEVGVLYERYSARILAYCLHALHDRGEAEDAVQTTFLQAQRALGRGVTPEHAFAWLHTIAKNACRMQKRTAARRAVVTGVDLDTYPTVVDLAEEKELRRALGDALATLPEAQRRALVMREWQGLSSAEVASRMGMSAPATYALLTRARQSLMHALTTIRERSALGVNVWPLLPRLKAFFAGGAAKLATATALGVVVVASGTAVERADGDPPGGARRDAQSLPVRASTATGPAARVTRTTGTAAARGRGGSRRTAPASGVAGAALVAGQPGIAHTSAPALLPPRFWEPTEPAAQAPEPPPVASAPPGALDTVPELPLPEVDIDTGVVTQTLDQVVPDGLLPPVVPPVLPVTPPGLPPFP